MYITLLVGVIYSTLCFVLSTEHIDHEHNSCISYKHTKRLTYIFHSVTVHLHNLYYVTLSLQILYDVECAFFQRLFIQKMYTYIICIMSVSRSYSPKMTADKY